MKFRLSRARGVHKEVVVDANGALVGDLYYTLRQSELVDESVRGYLHDPEYDFHLQQHIKGQYARMTEGGLYNIFRGGVKWDELSPVFIPDNQNFSASAVADIPTGWYGDGSDGDVTISVNTTLTRDMFYENLTIADGVVLNPGGYRIFVRTALTFLGTTGRIAQDGGNGGNGGDGYAGDASVSSPQGNGGAQGARGTGFADGYVGGHSASGGQGAQGALGGNAASIGAAPNNGVSGYTGTASNPEVSSRGTQIDQGIGTVGVNGGVGGAGGGTSTKGGMVGGAAGPFGVFNPLTSIGSFGGHVFTLYGGLHEAITLFLARAFMWAGGEEPLPAQGAFQWRGNGMNGGGGSGGGGGCNSGTGSQVGRGGGGGGGGGGGANGGTVYLLARKIIGTGFISANGGNGGNGGKGGNGIVSGTGTGAGGGAGGGGGAGCGGNGGVVFVIYGMKDSTISITVNAGNAGTPGNGGTAAGTGVNGSAGGNASAAFAGLIYTFSVFQ